ncbi:MAG TPA: MlaD family protein [Kiritimatiellia bacterium]|nr:MlaD family protein [Kiritimatiellia bacterium]HRZ12244.1 MlaD family protein [Kiritimatiellia bacterium]HSA17998.1 MlaD family protein [Kiritimatiellia bacterium]
MKRSRLQETSIEVTVGAFMFMVLLALGFFTIVLSRENLFSRRYELDVVFQHVLGLRQGDNVFVRGVDIGKVKALHITPEGVHVLASLEQPVTLREDYKIEILPSSVLGGRYLGVFEGSEDRPLLPEGSEVRGVTPVDLLDEATRTVQLIKKGVEEGKIIENISAAADGVRKLMARLEEGEGTLGKLLTDETLYKNLQDISANLKDITARVNEGKGTVGRLLSEDDTLYRDLSDAVAAVKDVTTSISEGDGTLGKLTRDDELYEQAKLLLNDIRAAIDDLRETTPVTTFTSVFFGAF